MRLWSWLMLYDGTRASDEGGEKSIYPRWADTMSNLVMADGDGIMNKPK